MDCYHQNEGDYLSSVVMYCMESRQFLLQSPLDDTVRLIKGIRLSVKVNNTTVFLSGTKRYSSADVMAIAFPDYPTY